MPSRSKPTLAPRCSAILVAAAAASLVAAPALASTQPAPDPQWGANQERLSPGAALVGSAPSGARRSSVPGATEARQAEATRQAETTAVAATPGWVLHGSGWGHGVGMSQYGASEMAKDGYKAAQILNHYYTGTTYDAVTDTQVLDVNVLYHVDPASTLSASTSALVAGGGAFTVDMAGVTGTMSGGAGAALSFSMVSGKIRATCGSCTGATTLTGTGATLEWDKLANDATLLKIGGTQYRDGTIRITPYTPSGATTPTSWNVVNRVRLHDEYLDYIAESPWSWNVEALKAQAAAARGYALAKYTSLGGKDQVACACHLLDTTSDQVYGGYTTVNSNGNAAYWTNWKNAVRASGSASTGYVARYQGKIIQAFFSSSSGGRTENNEDVWGATPLPYLRGVSDPWSLRTSNPARAWRQVTSGPSLAAAFGLPDVVRLDLSDRTVNGGVHTATATSSSGTSRVITGDTFRSVVASGSSFSGHVNSTMIRHLTGRLAGADRYASAAAVASRIPTSATSVVVVGADAGLSDASVSGPLAATVAGPLLLTQKGKLPAATVAELDRRGASVRTAYVVGGTGVVSDAVLTTLRSRGLTVQRIGGRDRYETAALVAKAIKARRTVTAVVVGGGIDLPDALSASGPASALGEPILLTPTTQLSGYAKSFITGAGVRTARVVGGTAMVSTAVEDQLRAAGITSLARLGGSNRYAVSATIAQFYRPLLSTTSEVVLASGVDGNMVDALVSSSLQRLIVLTSRYSLDPAAATALQSTPLLETVTAVGGTGVLYPRALTGAANS